MKEVVFVGLYRLFSLIVGHLVIHFEQAFKLPRLQDDLQSIVHLLSRYLKFKDGLSAHWGVGFEFDMSFIHCPQYIGTFKERQVLSCSLVHQTL